MYEWLAEMPRWVRFLIAGVFIAWAAIEFFGNNTIAVWPCAIGGVLLLYALFVGPSDAEKKGYKF